MVIRLTIRFQTQLVLVEIFIEPTIRMILTKDRLMASVEKYPALSQLIPSEEGHIIASDITMDGLLNIMRFIQWNTCPIKNWDVALKTYAAAQAYGVVTLQRMCEEFFCENPICTNYINAVHGLATRLSIDPVVHVTSQFLALGRNMREAEEFLYCFVKNSMNIEASIFTVPLVDIGMSAMNNFHKDISNEVVFESRMNCYEILGIGINLHCCDNTERKVYVEVVNDKEHIFFTEERFKSLNSPCILNLRKKLIVRPEQSASIRITVEDLDPGLCYSLAQNSMELCSSLKCSVRSHQERLHESKELCFIGEIFYHKKFRMHSLNF
ncbi:uncharacterized protein LOC118200530 [Stegodyphus dumicola]|uniref:uncharacterized protein LOC118200530 n=1 Tax=Stegodyphus dumicola TaxID=202533 RepID=UPI0015AC38CE|nr:uncharacterized protein LOC118200530 [Stegodyphus dumicola]